MKNVDYEAFRKWQQEKEGRTVDIKFGSLTDLEEHTIIVYDKELETAQLVNSVEEIDLETKRIKDLEKQIERLKKLKS